MRYPDTKAIVEHIYNDYMTRCEMIIYQNEMLSLEKEFVAWFDETWLNDIAVDIMKAYEDGNFLDVPESEIPAMIERYEYDDIFDLVDNYFYHNNKIVNVIYSPDNHDEIDPTLLRYIEEHRKSLDEELAKIKAMRDEAVKKHQEESQNNDANKNLRNI